MSYKLFFIFCLHILFVRVIKLDTNFFNIFIIVIYEIRKENNI